MGAERFHDLIRGTARQGWDIPMLRVPQLNAAIGVATSLDFEVLGTNAANTSATFSNSGGVTLTTAGASGDQVILVPHLDTTQTAIAVAAQFATDNSPYFRCWIRTGASIASTTIWAGLKKTNAAAITTDTDSLFVRYSDSDTISTAWQINVSNNNTDYTTSTGLTVAASTLYDISFEVDSNRDWKCMINGTDATAAAKNSGNYKGLKTGVNLIPYIGVQADTGAAKAIDSIRWAASRNLA